MWLILRLAATIAFIWYAMHGPLVAMVVSGVVAFVLLAKDAIANRRLIKNSWPTLLGLPAGLIVCWATGFLLVKIIGSPETVYVGPGFDRWNLPGTILGAATWIAAASWGARRNRSRQKTSSTQH
jgi:hypothetical protein